MTELFTCAERDDLGGGRIRHTQHLRPICYADASDGGRLKRIVSTWADSGVTARPHMVSASKMMVSVGDDGMRRIHPTRELDRYMEIGAPMVKVAGVWRKVGFTGATRTANSITWHRPQADLTITHGGHFVKLDMELLGGYVPEQGLVAFPVGMKGLTRKGGQILADGETVCLVREPVVSDAANPEDVRPIDGKFVNLDGQPYYLMTLPSLTGMARPVIDPTLTLQPAAADGIDTYVDEGVANANYGTGTTLYLSNTTRRIGLMLFTLTALPAGATITAATLTLTTVTNYAGDMTDTLYCILAANASWTEAGAKWNYQVGTTRWAGDVGSNGGADAGCSVSGTDYNGTALGTITQLDAVGANQPVDSSALNVAMVQAWAGGANYGFVMLAGSADHRWQSSDVATAGYRPKLVVVYELPGAGTIFQSAIMSSAIFRGPLG